MGGGDQLAHWGQRSDAHTCQYDSMFKALKFQLVYTIWERSAQTNFKILSCMEHGLQVLISKVLTILA